MSFNISNELASLPIDVLIARPLDAAVRAQAFAAETTVRFVEEVGLDEEGNVRMTTMRFSYTYVTDEGEEEEVEREISVPFLTMVPIPYIRISEVDIDLSFRIRNIVVDRIERSLYFSRGREFKWKAFKVSVNASYSSKRTTKSKIDRSAEVDIRVKAVQDEMPEGLRILLNILNEGLRAQEVGAPAGQGGGGQTE